MNAETKTTVWMHVMPKPKFDALVAEVERLRELREATLEWLAAVDHYMTETFAIGIGDKETAYVRMETARRKVAALVHPDTT